MNDKPVYKLLPYEYRIIDALEITKEEYLDFVAQQDKHRDIKDGTVLDVKNWEVVGIVLFVVGTIMQVVGALISANQPKKEDRGQAAARREEIFSPRYGFNTQQELAKYGDPVNLIYTNKDVNKNGGVRVATSLLWSAVLSYGNSQLLRVMMAVGAGGIGEIDQNKTAFGETTLKDFVSQNYFFFFKEDHTGALQNAHLKKALNEVEINNPISIGQPSDNPFRIRIDKDNAIEGFSHCYSPTSANVFGIYGAVPLNVDILIRDPDGNFAKAPNEITLKINGQQGYPHNAQIKKDQTFEIILKHAPNTLAAFQIEEARDSRRSLSTVFDNSGVLKFGSIKLKVIKTTAGDVVEGDMIVTLKSIDDGYTVSPQYNDLRSTDISIQEFNALDYMKDYKTKYDASAKIANALLQKDLRPEIKTEEQLLAAGNIAAEKPKTVKTFSTTPIPATQTNSGFSCPKGWTLQILAQGGKVVHQCVPKKPIVTSSLVYKFTPLTELEKIALQFIVDFKDVFGAKVNPFSDDLFFTKAFVRIEEASYETTSPCHIVDFSIRARVFKRINGRAPRYGAKGVTSGYRDSDNGYKYRSAMFLVKVKAEDDTQFITVPCIFVVRRANDIDNYVYLRFTSGLANGVTNAKQMQFKFEPIYDVPSELKKHPILRGSNGKVTYVYLENSGNVDTIDLKGTSPITTTLLNGKFEFTGKKRLSLLSPPVNEQPRNINEWDVFNNISDNQINFSFDNGPEFKIAAVSEQIIDSFENYKGSEKENIYDNLSLAGLNLFSGKSVADVKSLSLFVTKGRKCKLLKTSGNGFGGSDFQYLGNDTGYANRAPDVFLDTILDAKDGIGQYATIDSIDLQQLGLSKKFCEANGLFMDGVIADFTAWRQFWAENASFSLLELAKIGGRDTLVPGLPYDKITGEISEKIKVNALFNQGNIIEDSYKEDFIDYGENTQDAIVTVIYRDTRGEDSFSRNNTVQVNLKDVNGTNASRLTIDASQFVTNRDQAIKIGKLVCNTKRYSQRSIEFKTLPTDTPILPGAFVYVELNHNTWDNIYTGRIALNNILDTAVGVNIPPGSYQLLKYQQNSAANTDMLPEAVNVEAGNKVTPDQSNFVGYLFVIGKAVKNRRIFRVTEVQVDEEGEVTVRAMHHGTDLDGNSLIAKGIKGTVAGLFMIDGKDEQ